MEKLILLKNYLREVELVENMQQTPNQISE